MNDDIPIQTRRRSDRPIVQWGQFILATTVAIGGAITFSFSVYDGFRDDIADLGSVAARFESHVASDAELHRVFTTRLSYIEQRVDAIRTQTDARPDPFTGSEGRALADEIREVERRVDRLEIKAGED